MLGGQRDRTNEDGAATEELAKVVAVGVGGELRTEPDRGGYTIRCGASNRCRRLRVVSCPPRRDQARWSCVKSITTTAYSFFQL